MIPAGIRDHAVAPLILRKGSDLVVSPPQLKGPDWLLILGLEIKLAVAVGVRKRDQLGVCRDAVKALMSLLDIVQSNDGEVSPNRFRKSL